MSDGARSGSSTPGITGSPRQPNRSDRPGKRSPWPWRVAATLASTALCGGLMLALPVPQKGGPPSGSASAGSFAVSGTDAGSGTYWQPPVYVVIVEDAPPEASQAAFRG